MTVLILPILPILWTVRLSVCLRSGGAAKNRGMRMRWVIGLGLASGCGESADAPGPPPYVAPALLSETGLYADIQTKEVAAAAMPFTPAYELWSDGAQKRRWLVPAAAGVVDTTDPDHWTFPSGTRLFKEFARGGVRVETRLIERTGDGPDDFAMLTYAWRDDERDADLVGSGAPDVRGTSHDIPESAACGDCHGGEPGRILGFSAVQLAAGAGRAVLESLHAAGRISALPAPYVVPGDATVSAALGYLHANCGSCHNPNGFASEETALTLRLALAATTPETTDAYRTAVGVPLNSWRTFDFTTIVVPGDPEGSALLARMQSRAAEAMPPLATEEVDLDGTAAIRLWIEGLQ